MDTPNIRMLQKSCKGDPLWCNKNIVDDVSSSLCCPTDNHFISLEINFLLCKKKGIELGPCDLMISWTLILIGICFKQWLVASGCFIPSIVLVFLEEVWRKMTKTVSCPPATFSQLVETDW